MNAPLISAIAGLAGASILLGGKIGGAWGAAAGIAFFVVVLFIGWLFREKRRTQPLIKRTEHVKKLRLGPIPITTRQEIQEEQVIEGEEPEN